MSKTVSLASLLIAALVAGCAQQARKAGEEEISTTAVRGRLQGDPQGEVIFTKDPQGPGVKMLVDITGVSKQGLHAVHIHEKAQCRGNFKSAGGHFNPNGALHGHPDERDHHTGDLGNFRADASGAIVGAKTFDHLSLDPSDINYVGNKALIVHAKADDYSTQPTGAAGGRIGCALLKNTAKKTAE